MNMVDREIAKIMKGAYTGFNATTAAETESKDFCGDGNERKIIRLSDLEVEEDQDSYLLRHSMKLIKWYNNVPYAYLRFGDFEAKLEDFFDEAREKFADLPIEDEEYYVVDDNDKLSQSLAREGVIGLINMMYSISGINTTHYNEEESILFPHAAVKEDLEKLNVALYFLNSGKYDFVKDTLIRGIDSYREHFDSYIENLKSAILADVNKLEESKKMPGSTDHRKRLGELTEMEQEVYLYDHSEKN